MHKALLPAYTVHSDNGDPVNSLTHSLFSLSLSLCVHLQNHVLGRKAPSDRQLTLQWLPGRVVGRQGPWESTPYQRRNPLLGVN
jgi:hypothetical protein